MTLGRSCLLEIAQLCYEQCNVIDPSPCYDPGAELPIGDCPARATSSALLQILACATNLELLLVECICRSQLVL